MLRMLGSILLFVNGVDACLKRACEIGGLGRCVLQRCQGALSIC